MDMREKGGQTATPGRFLLLLTIFALLSTPLQAAEYDFAWPVADSAPGGASAMAKSDAPPYLKRQGRIGIAANLVLAAQALEPGDSLSLNLFADTPYRVIVQTVKHDRKGVVTITGHLEGEELSTFVLTGNPRNYLITLQDLAKNLTYRVSGDMQRGDGAVSEVDRQKMPPVIHLPPLTPDK